MKNLSRIVEAIIDPAISEHFNENTLAIENVQLYAENGMDIILSDDDAHTVLNACKALTDDSKLFGQCNRDLFKMAIDEEYGPKITFALKDYFLCQEAYIDGEKGNEYYTALSFDQEGNECRLYWDILVDEEGKMSDNEDEHCNWENPSKVEKL